MAKKRYPKSEAIASEERAQLPAYSIWDEKTSASDMSKNLGEYCGISRGALSEQGERSTAGGYDGRFMDFSNILPGISSRPAMNDIAYSFFRPGEHIPSDHRGVITTCNRIYEKTGLIKNVIDLMGDFASQGIRLTHPDKNKQEFFNNWFKKVKGPDRSERILNTLYRAANVVVRKSTGKLSIPIEERLYKTHAKDDSEKSTATPDLTPQEIKDDLPQVEKREIPLRYTILDASTVRVIGGALASFVGNPQFEIVLPESLKRVILAPKTDIERSIVDSLPEDIKAAARTKNGYPLPPDKTSVLYYKKDDWQAWAVPMIYPIAEDVVMLAKLKLADRAALDGAISNIRIFRLGYLDDKIKIMPTKEAAARLSEILQSNTGGGSLDIVWDKAIDLLESKTEAHKYLGEEKYRATLNLIYAGLGIPPTLTGTFGAAGTTNNFISLKTLTERLKYGRRVLVAFWEQEIALVQRAMGWRSPAAIEFDLMDLGNEQAIKTLYMGLADRNIISDETVQRIFEQNPDTERTRLNKEAKSRDSGKMVNKTGPYMEPQATESLKKIALQQGSVTPGQIGMELDPKPEGEKTVMDLKHEQDMKKQKLANQQKAANVGGQAKPARKKNTKGKGGRPTNSKDKAPRKKKSFSPKSRAALEVWANNAQSTIAEILNPPLLAHYGKRNLRQLSVAQAEEAEQVKFGVLSNMAPLETVDEKSIAALVKLPKNDEIFELFADHKLELLEVKKAPTLDDLKQVQICAYSDYYTDYSTDYTTDHSINDTGENADE